MPPFSRMCGGVKLNILRKMALTDGGSTVLVRCQPELGTCNLYLITHLAWKRLRRHLKTSWDTSTAMESKGQSAHFSQAKEGESVTLKVRFAQFKESIGPSSADGRIGDSCLKGFNLFLSSILLVRVWACLLNDWFYWQYGMSQELLFSEKGRVFRINL